jgi:hypothetical protein
MPTLSSSFLKMRVANVTMVIVTVACLVILATGTRVAAAQDPSDAQKMPYLDDWTHHHLVFSDPGTREDAEARGKGEERERILNDRRYLLQQAKRRNGFRPVMADPGDRWGRDGGSARYGNNARGFAADLISKTGAHQDWSVPLGGGAASYTFNIGALAGNISSSSTVTIDGVLFKASAPTPKIGYIVNILSTPANGSVLTLGGITYNFSTSTISATQPANTCGINTSSANNWVGALTNGAGTGSSAKGTGTWECNSDVVTDSAVTVVLEFNVDGYAQLFGVTAVIPGSTGFATPSTGSTGFSYVAGAAGSDGTTSGTSTPPTFAYWSGNALATPSQVAANIATAVNADTQLQGTTGVAAFASNSSLTITARANGTGGNNIAVSEGAFPAFTPSPHDLTGGSLTKATVQPNAFPAKFGPSLTTASCANDFVVYPTGLPGSATAANIIAFNNLYETGCSGSVPTAVWAYNTGGVVTTSPMVYDDPTGSQVAYVQVSGTTASLVLLKWAASSTELLSTPDSLTVASSASAYRSCPGPCYFSVSLGANDTYSSPFYDQYTDTIYVGDDSGQLHKITGVFKGTTIVEAPGFPAALSGNKIASPVYESNSGNVFVGDTGGILYSVGSGNAGTTAGAKDGTSSALGGTGAAIIDAPLVDSTAGKVYVFVSNTTGANAAVYQFPTGFTTGAGAVEDVGTGAAQFWLYGGTFDNVYYSSTAGNAGNLWVMGNTGGAGGNLYRIPINSSGAMTGPSTAITGLTNTSGGANHPWPSPITEFCNGACATNGTNTTSGTDYIFFSVDKLAPGTVSNCGTATGDGCVLSYNISTPGSTPTLVGSLQVATVGTAGCWATGGIIIDGSAATTGASQVYFINLNGSNAGNPFAATSTACTTGTAPTINAVQASQAALR